MVIIGKYSMFNTTLLIKHFHVLIGKLLSDSMIIRQDIVNLYLLKREVDG